MLYDDGLINSIDYQIYLKLFESFTDEYPVNKIIYVKTKPDICIERIKKRSRTGETNIQLDYLVNLDKYHNEMINSTIGYRSLLLDGDLDIYENSEIINYWIQIIKEFIYDNN
jgi:deoxyadenosine/deoxycytidine kinase